jgi:3-phosphoshikimate 1-carboxyvinyltransferase
MVDVAIKKTQKLNGEVCAPPSKSYTQRMLIASALSRGTSSKVSNPLLSEDTEATLRAITALGANVKREQGCWEVAGATELQNPKEPIDCGESGATFRFMIPLAALAPDPSILTFRGSLKHRPIGPLLKSLSDLGANVHPKKFGGKDAVLVEGGGILGGETSIQGDISSQFISGLIFACPLAKVDTEITLTSPLESADYVSMTQEVLNQHEVRVDIYGSFERIVIPANQTYRPCNSRVPGDFSSAAFLLAAAAITNSDVTISDLDQKSLQGDKAILAILKQMGVNGKVCENSVEINGTGNPLEPISVEAKNIPDLVPVITALACYARGESRIAGAQRLRIKESDRLSSLHSELTKMGAKIEVDTNGLTIRGPSSLKGAVLDPHNDHRIAMACSIAALGAEGQTTLLNAACVRKSYPQFFTHLKQVGADLVGGKFDR